jgi:plastocyanin
MRKSNVAAVTLALAVGYLVAGTFTALADDRTGGIIRVLDDCLPGDAGWNPTGGCTLNPTQGDVPFGEFLSELTAPTLATNTTPAGVALVGHPSWRNDPSHMTIKAGKTIQVVNDGGRGHTFTKVERFGGGVVGFLNVGQAFAPGCENLADLPPGGHQTIGDDVLKPGLNRFQCCIHPWMRATIRVEER